MDKQNLGGNQLFYLTLPDHALPLLILRYLTFPYLTVPYLTLPYLPNCGSENSYTKLILENTLRMKL